MGLEHQLKDEDCVKARIAEDIRVKGRTVDDAFRSWATPSASRSSTRKTGMPGACSGTSGSLTAQGFTEVQRRNFWTRPGEHKGIVSCWREPRSGTLLEVQFHTRPSYEAWQLTHPAYERLRHPRTSDAERADLKAFIRQAYGFFGPPPASRPRGEADGISETVTYYAIVDALSSRQQRPACYGESSKRAASATRRSATTWPGGPHSCSTPPNAAT